MSNRTPTIRVRHPRTPSTSGRDRSPTGRSPADPNGRRTNNTEDRREPSNGQEPSTRMIWKALNNVAAEVKGLKDLAKTTHKETMDVSGQILTFSSQPGNPSSAPWASAKNTEEASPPQLRTFGLLNVPAKGGSNTSKREVRQIYSSLDVDEEVLYKDGECFTSVHNKGVTRMIIQAVKDGNGSYRESQMKMACRNIHDNLRRRAREETLGVTDQKKKEKKHRSRQERLRTDRVEVGKKILSKDDLKFLEAAPRKLMSDEEAGENKTWIVRHPRWRSPRLTRIVQKCQAILDKQVTSKRNSHVRQDTGLLSDRPMPTDVASCYLDVDWERGDGSPSGGEGSPSGGEGSPSGGEGSPSGGEGSPSGGEGSPSGGEGSLSESEGNLSGVQKLAASETPSESEISSSEE
ncbi:Hypp8372 [Branchiostoma lanceolatum]|uniref:Hypp8372 protein n=1 Tax=Branchiostoma lanceolatum TaxID=7740 RepID=A0A8J9Z6U9_BRALA|nr:Hypp8372 [Branchiostoma lanceolatum]